MALRYIEFLKIDDSQVTLDITQIILEEYARCFHVVVHADQDFEFILCRDKYDEWKILTQEFSEFIVTKLFDPLTTYIGDRLCLERDYLTLN